MRITKYAAYAAALLAPVAAMATPPSPAPAPSPVDATFAASVVGVNSSTPSIGLDTTFSNTIGTIIGTATGDLSSASGVFMVLNPVTATVGTNVSFTSSIGDFTGKVTFAGLSGTSNNSTVQIYSLGDFTPKNSTFGTGPASLTFSFTQTGGANAAVSGSFTFASPPAAAPGVPEPASWAMMIGGFALTGAAVRRRREKTLAAA